MKKNGTQPCFLDYAAFFFSTQALIWDWGQIAKYSVTRFILQTRLIVFGLELF